MPLFWLDLSIGGDSSVCVLVCPLAALFSPRLGTTEKVSAWLYILDFLQGGRQNWVVKPCLYGWLDFLEETELSQEPQ